MFVLTFLLLDFSSLCSGFLFVLSLSFSLCLSSFQLCLSCFHFCSPSRHGLAFLPIPLFISFHFVFHFLLCVFFFFFFLAHYDFGMRNVKAILNAAGQLKEMMPDVPEDQLCLRAIHDCNIPKFVGDDLDLFKGITKDLFRGIEVCNCQLYFAKEFERRKKAKKDFRRKLYTKRYFQTRYERFDLRNSLRSISVMI